MLPFRARRCGIRGIRNSNGARESFCYRVQEKWRPLTGRRVTVGTDVGRRTTVSPAPESPVPDTADDFAALLARARRGDREALEQLARQYEPKLRLVARVLLGPALRPYLDSLDLVQSVHKSLLVGLRQDKFAINTPENLLALALTLVRRKV